MQTLSSNDLLMLANSLRKRGHNLDDIMLKLRNEGAADQTVAEIIDKLKTIGLDQKRRMGFIFCGIGVFLLVASCMITFLLFNYGGNIRWVMYGLTSLGIIATLKGLVDLFGW